MANMNLIGVFVPKLWPVQALACGGGGDGGDGGATKNIISPKFSNFGDIIKLSKVARCDPSSGQFTCTHVTGGSSFLLISHMHMIRHIRIARFSLRLLAQLSLNHAQKRHTNYFLSHSISGNGVWHWRWLNLCRQIVFGGQVCDFYKEGISEDGISLE